MVVTGSDIAIDLEMMTGVVGDLVVILVVGDWVFGGSVVVVGRVDNPRSRVSMNIWTLSFIVDWPIINLAMWNLVLMYSVCVKEWIIMQECNYFILIKHTFALQLVWSYSELNFWLDAKIYEV